MQNPLTHMSCALCGKVMSLRRSTESPISYFHCAGCGRWIASNYGTEALRSNTTRLTQGEPTSGRAALGVELERAKSRLADFLKAIDERDPYQILGVSPCASQETIRARFHALALDHHPDRGGDVLQMQCYTQAYERICDGQLGRLSPEQSKPSAPCTPHISSARNAGPGRR